VIEHLIAWLSGLPPIAVYTVIGLLAAVENVFPPVTQPWVVLLVTMVFNMTGAMAMYFLGARHATTLFQTRLARWLLPGDGLAFVQRE